MYALAFFIALVALIPFSSGHFHAVTTAEPLSVTRSTVALDNFLIYRQAVMAYSENNPSFTGTVADVTISSKLPPGYQKLGPWTNQISAAQIVVYGSSSIGLIGSSTLSNDSVIDGAHYLVGYAKNGNWESTAGGVISTAPAYVPTGAILAIINK
jgi:PilM